MSLYAENSLDGGNEMRVLTEGGVRNGESTYMVNRASFGMGDLYRRAGVFFGMGCFFGEDLLRGKSRSRTTTVRFALGVLFGDFFGDLGDFLAGIYM
tara:strand:- start:304 stop:594 length:291 start_codon:yes stop_codon:yes gene_type:complete